MRAKPYFAKHFVLFFDTTIKNRCCFSNFKTLWRGMKEFEKKVFFQIINTWYF